MVTTVVRHTVVGTLNNTTYTHITHITQHTTTPMNSLRVLFLPLVCFVAGCGHLPVAKWVLFACNSSDDLRLCCGGCGVFVCVGGMLCL